MSQYRIVKHYHNTFSDELLKTLPEGSKFLMWDQMDSGKLFSTSGLSLAIKHTTNPNYCGILETPDMEELPQDFKDFVVSHGIVLFDIQGEFTMKARYRPWRKGAGGPYTFTHSGDPNAMVKLYGEIPSSMNGGDRDYFAEQIAKSEELQRHLFWTPWYGWKKRLSEFTLDYGIEFQTGRNQHFRTSSIAGMERINGKHSVKTIEAKLKEIAARTTPTSIETPLRI